MSIKLIKIETGLSFDKNVKHYQCLTTDAVGTYPTDCGPGSTMKVLNATTKAVDSILYYDGTNWNLDGVIETKTREFEVQVEIIRPADTTAYAINDIINQSGASALPALDFGTANAGRRIQINSANILSDNGGAATKLNAIVQLLNSTTISGQSVADNAAFNPSYAELKAKMAAVLDGLYNVVSYGSAAYQVFQSEILRNATLDSTGKLYAAIIAANAYTPASGETITLIIKGYLL